jgi:peptide/nickel transport system permease protein
MKTYILKRVIHSIPLFFGITLVAFFIIQLAPGDYFTQLRMNPHMKPELLDEMRRQFGLDRPLVVQYFRWLWGILHLDFGTSFAYYNVAVTTLIKQRIFNTLYLSFVSMCLTWIVAIPIGIYCATHQYSLGDKVFSVLAFMGMSLPTFFVAFLLILLASYIPWLPIGRVTDIMHDTYSPIMKALDYLKHLIIPVSVLVATSIAGFMRLMRGNMLDVMYSQYILAARAKGVSERVIRYKHALRNAINPMITIFGYQLSGLISGAALTEIITQWPGLGRLMLDALMKQDLYLVMGSLVIGSVLLIVGNLLSDILLAACDPRIRYEK